MRDIINLRFFLIEWGAGFPSSCFVVVEMGKESWFMSIYILVFGHVSCM